jgi:beta-alanine degradation protein BauB
MSKIMLVILACCLAAPVLAQDSAKTDPKIIKITFENEQVRILKAHYEPGDKTAMHDHLVPRVVVFLTDQHAKITRADGSTVEIRRKAGDAVYFPPERHAVENLSDKPFETIEVELKSASGSDGGGAK